jgi:hypothetical protein
LSGENWLLWLNVSLPFILGWLVLLERRISKIEGYCSGRRSVKKGGGDENRR